MFSVSMSTTGLTSETFTYSCNLFVLNECVSSKTGKREQCKVTWLAAMPTLNHGNADKHPPVTSSRIPSGPS